MSLFGIFLLIYLCSHGVLIISSRVIKKVMAGRRTRK